ncbi:hypothetical protein [Nocardia fusca]|uniref:Uncharacterized protein n=1 Tax=Nocardia fusca TaxID=941183 RepID=A0ABV3FIM6_9NOCA
MITDNPATCDCRRRPWVTIAMLGGLYATRDDGIRLVKCPDSNHCLKGAPVIHGHLAQHWRNMEYPKCKWEGIRVTDSMPCHCGGWPWVRAETLKLYVNEMLAPGRPLKSVGCPGCRNSLVDVERSRIAVHTRHAGEPCAWSGIYVAVGNEVPPLGLKAPTSLATS